MEEGGEGDGRDVSLPQQLQALRQICIPQVCFLLLSVLHESGLYKKVCVGEVTENNNELVHTVFAVE